jgi:hypothetical protein
MKKSIAVAAFGGALVASCWLTAAPANAVPCDPNHMGPDTLECKSCLDSTVNNLPAQLQACFGRSGYITPGPVGTDQACLQSGICWQ